MATANTTMTAADIMTAAPRTCTPYSSVLEAVLIFRDADCGLVPIVEDGKPAGVLTDRDVALALAEYPDLASRAVSEIMTKDVVTVEPNATLDEVRNRFAGKAVRRLLVVDKADQLLGVISWADIANRASGLAVASVAAPVLEKPSTT